MSGVGVAFGSFKGTVQTTAGAILRSVRNPVSGEKKFGADFGIEFRPARYLTGLVGWIAVSVGCLCNFGEVVMPLVRECRDREAYQDCRQY